MAAAMRAQRSRRPVWRGLAMLLAARWAMNVAASRSFVPPAGRLPTSEHRVLLRPELAAAGAAPLLATLALGGSAAHAAEVAADAAIDPNGAIVQAFLLTFVSEIGDKTFFIAAILAAEGGDREASRGKNQKVLTFVGAIGALAVMTFLAVGLGQLFHAVPDIAGGLPVDDYASVLAFGFFGIKLLLDASQMEDEGSILDEREEAEEAVKEFAVPFSGGSASLVLPPVVLQAFLLVFAAEIGDRSFISAAALSAQGGPSGAFAVFVGGISAHAIATLLAVSLGDLISKYVSEKQLTVIGGSLFLLFAAQSATNLLVV